MKKNFEILPVVDLKGGRVVRGAGGQRHLYQPMESPLVTGGDFFALMGTLQKAFSFARCYVADLDAIEGKTPDNLPLIVQYRNQQNPMEILLDAGVHSAADAPPLLAAADRLMVGSETLESFAALEEMLAQAGPQKLMLSIDTKDGALVAGGALAGLSPEAAVRRGAECGVQDFFLLQLGRVGTGGGLDKEMILRCLEAASAGGPGAGLWVGGGVSSLEDLAWLEQRGVRGAFIASLLHKGPLAPPIPATFLGPH